MEICAQTIHSKSLLRKVRKYITKFVLRPPPPQREADQHVFNTLFRRVPHYSISSCPISSSTLDPITTGITFSNILKLYTSHIVRNKVHAHTKQSQFQLCFISKRKNEKFWAEW
jgi:hypothetical protein